MATEYAEGFEPISAPVQAPAYAEGFEPITPSSSVDTAPISAEPSDYEVFRQQYIDQQQAPTALKALQNTIALVQGLYGMAKDIASIPAGLGEASGTETPVATTLASLIEGARRTGTGFINLGRMGLDKAIRGFLANPINPTSGLIQQEISGINPIVAQLTGQPVGGFQSRTPSEQEIQSAFQEQILQESLNRPENRLVQGEISEPLSQGSSAAIQFALPFIGAAEAAAAGSLLRRPVTGLANTLERVVSRGVTKPLEDVITQTTGIAAIDGGVETAQIAKARIVEKTGKFPTREAGAAEQVVNQAEATGKALIEETQGYLKSAGDKGLVVNEIAGIEKAKDTIRQRFKLSTADEGVLDSIFDKPEFRNLRENVNPLDTQAHLREFNTKYNEIEPRFQKRPDAMAYKIVRDYLSDQVDGVVKYESGKDISPYRDWGHVQDFKNGIQNEVRGAQQRQSGKEPTSGRIPATPKGAIVKGVQELGGRPFIARDIEAINQGALKIGRGVKNPPKGGNLTSKARAALGSQFINTPPVIGKSTVAPVIPPPNLERLIQQRMREYPENIRRSGLARYAAEQQLADEGIIPPQ